MKNSKIAETSMQVWEESINHSLGALVDSLFPSIGLRPVATYNRLYEVRPALSRDETQDAIKQAIESAQPFMASRFGSTELRVLLKYKNRNRNTYLQRAYKMLVNIESPVWSAWEHRNIRTQSGFFPIDRQSVDYFSSMYIDAAKDIDLLGSWVRGENQFLKETENSLITKIESLEPFFSESPWTSALKDQSVLVIHPFADSIKRQYAEHRTNLFKGQQMLPEFKLTTLRPPQTLVRETEGWSSWFEGLDYLKEQVQSLDFQVALVACGAYGMPISAHLKSIGKTVIHLGGPLQLLFGITGNRWRTQPEYSKLFNEHWTCPSQQERPPGHNLVDKGVYW